MKKALSLILAILLSASFVVSCTEGTENTNTPNETSAADSSANGENTEAEEAKPVRVSDGLTFTNYDGASFNVYTANVIAGIENSLTINYAAEQTGEIVNDTLFARDLFIKEKYNVDFKIECDNTTSDVVGMLSKNIAAADDVYQMILHDQAVVAKGLSMSGNAYPLNMISTIKLGEEYWMPELNAAGKIGNSTYFTASAISPRLYGSAYITMFNRDMATNLGIENLYQVVNDGRWTFDKLCELSRVAVNDENGDGQVKGDGTDQIGIASDCFEMPVLGAGFHFIENQNGELRCCCEDEKLVSFMQKVAAFFTEEGIFSSGTKGIDMDACINNGKTLFFVVCSFALDEYRSLDYDYGILPSPKYDENQEEYVEFSQPWVAMTPVIPITVVGEELEMSGDLTNAMAAYGYDYIEEAAFENVVCYKGARDEESAQIIDKIFENITFELCSTLGFDQLYSTCQKYLCGLATKDITTSYAAIKEKTEKAIAKVVDTYAENESKLG